MSDLRRFFVTVVSAFLAASAATDASADTKTWTGNVSTSWSEAGNWAGGVPVAGDRVVFPIDAQPNRNLTNDLAAGLSLYDVTFSGDGYVISGNAIELEAGIRQTAGPNTLDLDIVLAASQTIRADVSVLILGGQTDVAGSTLTFFDGGGSIEIDGALAGTGTLSQSAPLTLSGTSSFSGPLQHLGGRLHVTGSAPDIDVTQSGFSPSSELTGDGTIGNVAAEIVRPGDPGGSTGILSTSDFLPAILEAQLNGTTAGTGYDRVSVVGAVDVSGASLALTLGYSASSGDTYTIIANDGADAVVGEFVRAGTGEPLAEGNVFAIGGYEFEITYVGGDGNDVAIECVRALKSWTGAVNDLWSEAGNWNGGVPAAGDQLVFPDDASANRDLTNDLPAGLSLYDLTFTGDGYAISGNGIVLETGIRQTTGPNTLDLDIVLAASQTIRADDGVLTLGGEIDVTGNVLTFFDGGGSIEIDGALAGTGTLTQTAPLTLSGASSFSGPLQHLGGRLHVTGEASDIDVTQSGFAPSSELTGDGVIGDVAGEVVRPGNPGGAPGILATGNLESSSLELQLNGALPGIGHDQVSVAGTVDITDVSLLLTLAFTPARGQPFLIVDNDEADAVTGEFLAAGTFDTLAEGETFNLGPYPFEITYVGGTGNDVVVTSLSGDPFNAAPESENDAYELDTGGASFASLDGLGGFGRAVGRSERGVGPMLDVGGSGVLANDDDPDDDALSIALAPTRSVRGGTVNVAPSGAFTYEPPSAFLGQDSFLYLAGDGKGGAGFAYVQVVVHECGNGSVESPAEECDDGELVDGDGCDSNCTFTACGNGITTSGESCDDGNTVSGDCCTAACDAVASAGTLCASDSNACTDDVCDNAGNCVHEPNAAPCSDADPCTTDDVCADGQCSGGDPLDCDDGNPCTVDSCDEIDGCVNAAEPQPAGSCMSAEKAQIQISLPSAPEKRKLAWKWTNGPGILQAELGSPDSTTTYTLCVYDQSATGISVATRVDVMPGTLWTTKDPKGWLYNDKAGSSDGVQKVQLKTGIDGKTKSQMKAGGTNLPDVATMGTSQTFAADPSVVVQLLGSNGLCLTSEFSAPRTNDGTAFKAKAP